MRAYHDPVLVEEILDLLDPRGGLFLDGTLGGGGHARALLERCRACSLLAVDVDPDALETARRVLAPWSERVRFLHARFDTVMHDTEVRDRGLEGALLDLGMSSWQLDHDPRGFAFRRGLPLDMRMDPTSGAPTAADLLRDTPEDELVGIFRDWGEEPRARKLAREVVRRRRAAPPRTSDDVVAALAAALGRAPTQREKARIFQALRIAVNREMDALDSALEGLREVLVDGGVLAVVSYHSLEDRKVKHAFGEWSRACVCPRALPICRCRGRALGVTLTRKPVEPSAQEVERNPRARSARLRAWRRAA